MVSCAALSDSVQLLRLLMQGLQLAWRPRPSAVSHPFSPLAGFACFEKPCSFVVESLSFCFFSLFQTLPLHSSRVFFSSSSLLP